MRMQAGQQRGSRGAAARRVVELRVAQSAERQAVEIGRFDLAAIAADIREAHVVVQDDQNVRAVGHCIDLSHRVTSGIGS
jgi:hypothetical protein